MTSRMRRAAVLGGVAVLGAVLSASPRFPDPAVDPKPASAGPQTAVLAGGCFWGVEAVF